MDDWKKQFSEKDISRAEKYRVTDLCAKGKACYVGDVRTTVTNHVKVYRDGSGLYGECSCGRDRDDPMCIHMAAMCNQIEMTDPGFFGYVTKWSEAELKSRAVHPFSASDGEGCYFDTRKIFSCFENITEAMVSAAEKLIDSGKVTGFDIGPSGNYLRSSCTIQDVNSVIKTEMFISTDRVAECECSDGAGDGPCEESDVSQRYYYGLAYFRRKKHDKTPCIHKLVLALLTARYIWEKDPGDATDSNAEELMKYVAAGRKIFRPDFSEKRELHKEGQVIDIVPVLNSRENRLSFTIGVEKQFVVNDYLNLVDRYKSGSTMQLGKNTVIDFSSDGMTERAGTVMKFLSSIGYVNSKKYMDLKPAVLDSLYQLCSETEVVNEHGKVMEVSQAPARLKYDFMITKHKGQENMIAVTITFPRRGDSWDRGYLIDENRIVMMDIRNLGPFCDMVPESPPFTKKYSFGKARIPEFYNNVLPQLEQYGEVNRSLFSDSARWAAIVPSFTFFLDMEGECITCEAHMMFEGRDTVLIRDSFRDDGEHTDAKWVKSQLKALFPVNSYSLWETETGNTDQMYTVLRDGLPVLLGMGDVNISDTLKNITVRKPSVINAAVSFENDLLELDIETKDMSGEELLELLASYRLKKRYHRLKDGSFIDLSDNALDDFAEVAASLNLTDDQIISGHAEFGGYRALFIDQLLEGRKDIVTDRDGTFRKMVRDFTGFRESDEEVPSSLSAVMRPYQKDGFRWLKTLYDYRFGGILADEMGLGKTIQVISLMLSLKQSGVEGTNLVVCPASLVYNWEAELEKFAPELSCSVMAGTPEERKNLIASIGKYDVAITSYDLLKRDISLYKDRSFHLLIIDEAQYVKNQGTGASKTVRILNAKVRFALTGTPIENRLSELWSIFDFLMPGFLYNYERFRRDIELPVMKKSDAKASSKLKSMVSPFILRRLKTDVLRDLPEKLEEVSYSEMTEGQRKLYDAKVLLVRKEVEESDEQTFKTNKLRILSELTRLRQLCCDPSLVFEDYKEGSGKLDSTMDLVGRAIDEGHRMLLFSQFTSMLSVIAGELDKKNIRYYVITGETPKSERLRLVESFNNGSTPVFLISLRAGGTGLNLTGADVVIHYDPWWNAAVQDQATDRAHRIGQTKVVTVYSMIAKNTIEDKIIKMQERKKDLADEVLSGETAGLSSLTREDLLEMLS
ncbi:MAG: DEAD/DEAH box helicase [Bullifex sp.]